jgi:hypothetical protein
MVVPENQSITRVQVFFVREDADAKITFTSAALLQVGQGHSARQ